MLKLIYDKDELDELRMEGAICVKIENDSYNTIRSVYLWFEPIITRKRNIIVYYFNTHTLNKNTNDYYVLLPLRIFDYEALIEMRKNYKDRIFWLTQIYQKYDVPITMEGKWEKMLKS